MDSELWTTEQFQQLALSPSRELSFSSMSSSSQFGSDYPIHEQDLQLSGCKRSLPSDYEDIILRSVNPVAYATSNDLYLSLCDSPILLDGGKMSFHIDKTTGKNCYMIGAKELVISCGDTPLYWKWTNHIDSRFSLVAELLEVSWLDIQGKIATQMLSLRTQYVAYLIFKLGKNVGGLGLANGIIRFVNCENDCDALKRATTLNLQPKAGEEERNGKIAVRRPDGWMEVEIGNFYNDKGDDGMVEARLLETRFIKRGLIVEGIEFRPSNDEADIFRRKRRKGIYPNLAG